MNYRTLLYIVSSIILSSTTYADEFQQLHDAKLKNYTSTGSIQIENTQIYGHLTVTGPAYIKKSNIGKGNIIGPLKAEYSTITLLDVIGPVTLTMNSSVESLDVTGPISLSNTSVKNIQLNGNLLATDSKINEIDAASSEIHLWNTTVDKISVKYYKNDGRPIVIKCLGTSKIKQLTLFSSSKTEPKFVILLDDMTTKTFNKNQVQASGDVKYTTKYPY